MNEQPNQPETKWVLKREVSIPDIISFVCALIAIIFAFTNLDKRVSIEEAFTVTQAVVDKRQDADIQRLQNRIELRLDRMDTKLDTIIERYRK